MARKKKDSDLGIARPAMGLVGGGVILGVGSSVVGSVGDSTAASAQAGLGAAASFLPTAGTIVGADLTLRQLERLKKAGKRRTKNGR